MNSFQQFKQIVDRIEAAVEREAQRQEWEHADAQDAYQEWLFDYRLLAQQQSFYHVTPSENRRFFQFWHGDGSTYWDKKQAESLNRLCDRRLFVQTDTEMGIYRITDVGLKS